MKAFLLICTSIKSSILSSLFIVWFDRHKLIMNDQALPLKHEQPEYTEVERVVCVCVCLCVCVCVCVFEREREREIPQELELRYMKFSSTFTIFSFTVPAVSSNVKN